MLEAKPLDRGPEEASKYLRGEVLPQLFGNKCVQCVEACIDLETPGSWPVTLSKVANIGSRRTFDPKLNPYCADVIDRYTRAMYQHHPARLTYSLAHMFAHQLLLDSPVLSGSGIAKGCLICEKAAWDFAGQIAGKAKLSPLFDTTSLRLPGFSDVEWDATTKDDLTEFSARAALAHSRHGARERSEVIKSWDEEEF